MSWMDRKKQEWQDAVGAGGPIDANDPRAAWEQVCEEIALDAMVSRSMLDREPPGFAELCGVVSAIRSEDWSCRTIEEGIQNRAFRMQELSRAIELLEGIGELSMLSLQVSMRALLPKYERGGDDAS